MMEELGIDEDQVLNLMNVIPGPDTAAALNEAVAWGADMVFGTSVGYGTHFQLAATTHPDVRFFHAGGFHAVDSGLENFHNYVANLPQARFLSGVAAGLRTETNRIGFVAAHPEPEVIADFTAFFLGARSVNPDVVMDVMYMHMWNNPIMEALFASMLIDRGVDVVAVHADSSGEAVITAEERGVWGVGFNNDMIPYAPNAALVSPMLDWSHYINLAVSMVVRGGPLGPDFLGGLVEGMVFLSPLNSNTIASGTDAAISSAESTLRGGQNIFTGPLVDNEGNTVVADGEAWRERLAAPSWTYILQGINIVN
jgi:basic membrane protein A